MPSRRTKRTRRIKRPPPCRSWKKGDALKLLPPVQTEQQFTKPPPRFTEATLIKMLEQNGIGRPSTYAPILATVQEREYVKKTAGAFEPTEVGFHRNRSASRVFRQHHQREIHPPAWKTNWIRSPATSWDGLLLCATPTNH